MFDLFWVPNFIKIRHIEILGPNLPKYLILGQDPEFQISFQISFMINELDLLWVPNFIAFWMYFIFATTSSWDERINTCFTVECVLLGRNFDFLGGYLVVTALYLIVTGGYWWLLLVTVRYRSLLLVPTFSMDENTLTYFKRVSTECFCDKFCTKSLLPEL